MCRVYPFALRRLAVLFAIVLPLGLLLHPAFAEDTPEVIRVEEDWELQILEPDPNAVAPQVTCVISPVGSVESLYAALTINHQTLPDYTPGGLQLQLWVNEEPLAAKKFPQEDLLNTDGETVTWTQEMKLEDGQLVFEVTAGTSETWGTFGGQGYLKISVPTAMENLGDYSSNISTEQSGIGFAANRTAKLVLKEVRWYTSDGQVYTDTEDKIVHEHSAQ